MITVKLTRAEQAILLKLLTNNCCMGGNVKQAEIAAKLYDKLFAASAPLPNKAKPLSQAQQPQIGLVEAIVMATNFS